MSDPETHVTYYRWYLHHLSRVLLDKSFFFSESCIRLKESPWCPSWKSLKMIFLLWPNSGKCKHNAHVINIKFEGFQEKEREKYFLLSNFKKIVKRLWATHIYPKLERILFCSSYCTEKHFLHFLDKKYFKTWLWAWSTIRQVWEGTIFFLTKKRSFRDHFEITTSLKFKLFLTKLWCDSVTKRCTCVSALVSDFQRCFCWSTITTYSLVIVHGLDFSRYHKFGCTSSFPPRSKKSHVSSATLNDFQSSPCWSTFQLNATLC